MRIDDIEQWKFAAAGKQVTMEGKLSTPALRQAAGHRAVADPRRHRGHGKRRRTPPATCRPIRRRLRSVTSKSSAPTSTT